MEEKDELLICLINQDYPKYLNFFCFFRRILGQKKSIFFVSETYTDIFSRGASARLNFMIEETLGHLVDSD